MSRTFGFTTTTNNNNNRHFYNTISLTRVNTPCFTRSVMMYTLEPQIFAFHLNLDLLLCCTFFFHTLFTGGCLSGGYLFSVLLSITIRDIFVENVLFVRCIQTKQTLHISVTVSSALSLLFVQGSLKESGQLLFASATLNRILSLLYPLPIMDEAMVTNLLVLTNWMHPLLRCNTVTYSS